MFKSVKVKAVKAVKAWVKDETSASQTTETGMLMLGGIFIAIGLGFLASKYMKSSGTTILTNMGSIAGQGISPDTPPAGSSQDWNN